MKRESPSVRIWEWLQIVLVTKPILLLLFIVNFIGSIGGFIWYERQLQMTHPVWLRIFVPDSPMASTAFTLVLLTFMIGKRNGLLEAFATVTSFKYGLWAIAMILWGAQLGAGISPLQWMLVMTHAGMALEALFYFRYYIYGTRHLIWVALWTFTNDAVDYLFKVHPWVARELAPHIQWVGFFTVGLSLVSLLIFWYLMQRRKGEKDGITSSVSATN